MDLAILEAYDDRRDFSNKGFKSACYAPFVSMFFDTLGQVRVCCVNYSYTLGNVRSQRLDDIWNGAATKTLREAMAGYDFGLGCDHCKWQIQDGHPFPHSTKYDLYPIPAEGEFWPRNMEFNLSNTCNLECVMCSGELSSAIRSRRDRYPPLAKVYDDQFFLDLRKYLPHLVATQCLGGEPFLIREQYRVWDMLIEDGLKPACQITTNGTQYNDKVERILNNLPVEITISMDGISKETLESLRINVRHDELMANFHRFHAYSKAHGRGVGFNFTLMRQNWHEFADFLLFAEQWGSNVNVCTLLHPAPYALYTLPTEEIRSVVAELERRDDEMCRSLVVNRKAWSDVLTRSAGASVTRGTRAWSSYRRDSASHFATSRAYCGPRSRRFTRLTASLSRGADGRKPSAASKRI
ncbi:MAG: SPASM domain-containing protein [Planctomycetota bacterium]